MSALVFPSFLLLIWYQYTLFAESSMRGTPPVRALFFEFPNEPELFGIDRQFLIGRDILVTPVLEPNATKVTGKPKKKIASIHLNMEPHSSSLSSGTFPGQGSVVWRDWYTHDAVKPSADGTASLSAPLNHINVHIRDHAALLLHSKPGYTTTETRKGPYSLLVSQDSRGAASGTAYIDDGESYPPGPNRILTFQGDAHSVKISGNGTFHIDQVLDSVTVLGVSTKPQNVVFNGRQVSTSGWTYSAPQQKLVVQGLSGDLNKALNLQWS